MNNPDLNFPKAIAPLTPASLVKDYWEQRPLIISERPSNYYAQLTTLVDVDKILFSLKPDWKKLRLIKQGRHFARNFMHPDGTPNITQVYRAYNLGYTLNLLDVQERWLPLAAIARDWESYLHHPVAINLYLTPQNSKAFRPHFDDHDVFILQIEGEKDWQIWQPLVELPGEGFSGNKFLSQDELGEPTIETKLTAGDLLYLPRGWSHDASTTDRASLHLTIGVFVYTWSDLLEGVLDEIQQKDLNFHGALPVGFMREEKTPANFQADFEQMLTAFTAQANLESAIPKLGKKLIAQMKEPLPGSYIQDLDRLDNITPDTLLEKKADVFYQVTANGTSITVEYPGNTLQLPKTWSAALHDIIPERQFALQELPGNDTEKIDFVQRLIRGGLLKITQPVN